MAMGELCRAAMMRSVSPRLTTAMAYAPTTCLRAMRTASSREHSLVSCTYSMRFTSTSESVLLRKV